GESGAARGILLLSDGADTTGTPVEPAIAAARANGMKVSAVCLGSDRERADIAVRASGPEGIVAAGREAILRANLRQHGFDGREATLVVREGGAEGVVVERRTITLAPAAEPQDIEARITPRAPAGGGIATVEYRAEIAPLAPEMDTNNNADSAFVRVADQMVRVCVLEGEPSWDTRALMAALRD